MRVGMRVRDEIARRKHGKSWVRGQDGESWGCDARG